MKSNIKAFISKTTFIGEDKIKDESHLFEEGIFDSMGLLSLISFLEEEYGVSTSDSELSEENFSSVNAISAYVERKIAV